MPFGGVAVGIRCGEVRLEATLKIVGVADVVRAIAAVEHVDEEGAHEGSIARGEDEWE